MASNTPVLPNGLIAFGPDSNCTLDLCPVEWSVYQYRPSLPANILFLSAFGIAMLIHIFLGIRWKSWCFMFFMILGCLAEMVGYLGRILLYNDPFSFIAFMIQIVMITTGPVFFTASVYVTLSKTIFHLAPEISRFNPKLFYWIFIPADLVCLVLQAAGGAMSTSSSGSSQTGVDITMAGLGLQVAVLSIFSILFADYMIRYLRNRSMPSLDTRMRIFFAGLVAAVLLILGRSTYRCYELSKGYSGSNLVTDQGLFIALEGIPVALAAFSLCFGHPGLFFNTRSVTKKSAASSEMEYRP